MIHLDEDVKQPTTATTPQAEQTAEQPSQAAEQTPEAPQVEQPQAEPVAPIEQPKGDLNVALKKEREMRRELQRQLAEKENAASLERFDPNDLEQIVQHPLVQELMLKQAKQELTDYAREKLSNLDTIPEVVKKAILKNVRGFVNETTTDINTAKLDIDEYIEGLAEESANNKQPEVPTKEFPVATTNVPATETSGANSAEVEKILNKPVDEMSPAELKVASDFRAKIKK